MRRARSRLPPNQPQSIRVNARAPQGLADGEYRVHMLFRAIPDPKPVTDTAPKQGVSFQLTPVYGVTIPVIVRLGNLEAKAGDRQRPQGRRGRQAGDRARPQPRRRPLDLRRSARDQGRRRRPDRASPAESRSTPKSASAR